MYKICSDNSWNNGMLFKVLLLAQETRKIEKLLLKAGIMGKHKTQLLSFQGGRTR